MQLPNAFRIITAVLACGATFSDNSELCNFRTTSYSEVDRTAVRVQLDYFRIADDPEIEFGSEVFIQLLGQTKGIGLGTLE